MVVFCCCQTRRNLVYFGLLRPGTGGRGCAGAGVVEGEKGGEMIPEQVDKLITFGQMALEQGWYDQAREYFEQAVALNAHSEEAWLQLAKLADEREQVLACLDKVVSINPGNVEARGMIDRLRRQTDPDELRAMLQIAIEIGDKQAARSYCLKILDTDPGDEQTWITLGRSCDDWDEALAHFRQVLAINPESAQAKAEIKHVLEQKEKHCWAFAKAAIESGDKEQACKYLHKVLEISPKKERAWLELGELTSDRQEALGYLEHVLTINTANERARAAIRQIKEEQEDERLRVRQELEQARAEREAEHLRARQELEQARDEEELARWGHLIGVSEESVEPPRKVVGGWTIPSVDRIARIGIALVSVLLIIGFVATHLEDTSVPVTESKPTPTMIFREAIERAQQATVALGVPSGERCQYAGSGTIIDSKGLIVTNAHVVGKRYALCVMFATEVGGETDWHYNAQVLKRDTSKDLAVLKVARNADGTVATNVSLNAVPMGDSDKLYAGDTVYICGYPAVGGYNVTLTQGLVSGFEAGRTLIKTDAEISPGSSGGKAVTENGLLIGIPTFVQAQPLTAGKIGYLIPVNEVQRFLQSYTSTPTPRPTPTKDTRYEEYCRKLGEHAYDFYGSFRTVFACNWACSEIMAHKALPAKHDYWAQVKPPEGLEELHNKRLDCETEMMLMASAYVSIPASNGYRAYEGRVNRLCDEVFELKPYDCTVVYNRATEAAREESKK